MKTSTLTKQVIATILIVMIALAAMPVQQAHAAACSWDGSSNTNWATGANWTGCTGAGGVPATGDTITIPSGVPNQPTLGAAATVAGLTVNSGATLTLGSQQLTVNGPVSNAGTITASSGRLMQQSVGNFTNSGTVTFTGNGRIYFTGNVTNTGTLTLGSAEVRFYGADAGPFTVAAFSTTGVIDWRRTAGTVTFAGNVSATELVLDNGGGEAGTLILGSGNTFTFPTVSTITGVALTNNGTLTVSTLLQGNGTLTNSSTGTLNITGGTSSISALANAGIVSMSGASTSSTTVANFTNTGTVNLNTTGTITGITNNAAGTVNLTNSGTITSFNNATSTSTLNISDLTPPTITTLTVTAAGNTVNYNGSGNQAVRATAFRNLILSGSGVKTLPVGSSTTGNLQITGTATATPTGTAITVNSLTLGSLGTGPASSTWGSTASAATNKTNTYFTTGSAGYLTVTTDTRTAQATLSVTGPASATYGTTPSITTSGGSGSGALSYAAVASTGCTVAPTTGVITVTNASGTCTVNASKASDGNYLAATSANVGVTLVKANQAALSITAPASATFGAPDATITTSGGSGSGAVTFDAGASTACSIVAGNLHVVSGTGTCNITATKAADNNYNSTTSVSFPVTINKANQAALSITAPASATFGDADATISTSGGTTGGTVTFDAGASTACSIVAGKLHVVSGTGTCAITVTMAGDSDYNSVTSGSFPVTISKANQAALTITAPASATFGAADATITTSGGSGSGAVTFDAGASTACSIVAGKLHVVSGTGTCDITASKATDNDYNQATSASFPVTINKATQATLSITAPSSMTFGDADATINTSGGSGSGAVTFDAGASTACSIVAGNLHVLSGTGTCDITATKAADNDYNSATSASFPVTINKANQAALSITAPASATFGDADATISTSGGTTGGIVTFDAGASTACSIVAGKLHVVSGTGTCAITATMAGDADYNDVTSASFPVTISKGNQATLSITAPASATFGTADATITTSGGSGSGTVTFDAGASTACSIVAGKLHVVSGTGTCDITASKAADNDYNATTSASFSVTINKANQAALSITAPAAMTFGDADATISTSGGTTGGTVTFDAGASTACSIVAGKLHVVSGTGTCDITATMAGDNDYSDVTSASFPVTISKANQTALSITAPASATFGAADATITTSGGSGSGAVTFDAGASTACSIVAGKLHVDSGTGTCDITASKAADNDYNSTTSTSFPVTINKGTQATLIITGPSVATIGNPDVDITTSGGSGTGAVTFDAGASTGCSIVAGKLHPISSGGTCNITATKAADNDYSQAVSASFPVIVSNKLVPTVSTTSGPFTYDGTPHAAVVNGSVAGTVSDVKYNGSSTAPTDAGTYNVTADFLPSDTNTYETLNDAAAGSITINKASLTVTANNQTIISGNPDPAFTFSYSGFVNNETSSVIDTQPTCTVSGAHSAPGFYPIVCSGGVDNNYAFNYINGTLTVTVNSAPPVISEGASVNVTMSQNGLPIPFALTLNATDPNSDPLTWSIFSQGTNGVAGVVAGPASSTSVSYIPALNFFGTDSFVVQVSDGALTDTITVNVTITAVQTSAPVVLSSTRADPNPTADIHVNYIVTFSTPVSGVDMSDFTATMNGGVVGSAVIAVSGSGSVYTVTVNTGSNVGTIRLDVLDDNSIVDAFSTPLDGGFTSGEVYTIVRKSPIFADVPFSHWANSYIERLYNAGITGGCGTDPLIYCPSSMVTRAQMAVFIMKTINGPFYVPPSATGTVFNDVPSTHWAAAWIEQFRTLGLTAGCGNNNYCPEQVLTTRAQMAVFLLRAKYGAGYHPPVASGTVFNDISADYWAAAWIEQLAAEGITSGCGGGNYCPEAPLSRAEMAVFLVKTLYITKEP